MKNSDDCKKETPTTCRNDLYAQHARWLKQAGAQVESDSPIELSPLVSNNGEELSEVVNGKALSGPLNIDLDKSDNTVKFLAPVSL